MKPFWISWCHKPEEMGEFELHWPWWITGFGDEEEPICAGVQADSEDAAKEMVIKSYDKRPENIEWRFCSEQSPDWTPFNDRFRPSAWMKWPQLV